MATTKDHHIQVFTPEGRFLRKFGSSGSDTEKLNGPTGIVIDNSDRVYVNERDNDRVSIFTTQGHFLKHFGSYGEEEGTFDRSRTIRVDENGFIFVANSNRL